MKKRIVFYFALLFGLIFACSDEKIEDIYKGASDMTHQLDINWSDAADKSVEALTSNFYFTTSQYFASEIWWDLSDDAEDTQKMVEQGNMNLWSQANALSVLLDAFARTNDDQYMETIEIILNGIYTVNGFSYLSAVSNAESEAIGEVLLRLYDMEKDETKKTEYWEAAQTLFSSIMESSKVNSVESEEDDGVDYDGMNGIPTSALEVNQRSTVTNALGVIMAMHMYHISKALNEEGDEVYLSFAKNVLDFCSKALYEGSGLVYNKAGMNSQGTIILTQDKVSYSVNQGLMIGAVLSVYNITKEEDLLKYANLFATYQIKGSYTERPIWNLDYPVFMPDYKTDVLVGTLDRSIFLGRGIFFHYLPVGGINSLKNVRK